MRNTPSSQEQRCPWHKHSAAWTGHCRHINTHQRANLHKYAASYQLLSCTQEVSYVTVETMVHSIPRPTPISTLKTAATILNVVIQILAAALSVGCKNILQLLHSAHLINPVPLDSKLPTKALCCICLWGMLPDISDILMAHGTLRREKAWHELLDTQSSGLTETWAPSCYALLTKRLRP